MIQFGDALCLFVHITLDYSVAGDKDMEQPSKDDALEALDFVINVLKEHEKKEHAFHLAGFYSIQKHLRHSQPCQ